MNSLMCSAAPAHLALNEYHRQQDAQPDESAAERERAIKGIANYLQLHVFKVEGRITETERTALNYFGLRMAEGGRRGQRGIARSTGPGGCHRSRHDCGTNGGKDSAGGRGAVPRGPGA